ncbi:MAG: TIGR03986 family CRISPR-associated RAMP protein, partial [Calditrichaeota bacterium]
AALGPNGEKIHIIPGTSVKGILRSVMEIASFGRMNRVSDHRYSIRDLNYKPYTSQMTQTITGNVVKPLVKAGWIEQTYEGEQKKWYLFPCDYARVEIRDLERYHGGNIRLNRKLSSVQKYNMWQRDLQLRFNCDEKDYSHQKGRIRIRYKKARNLGAGNQIGTLVMTGQPYPRNEQKGNGKHMDFIFFNTKNTRMDVSALRNDFEFIHSEEDEPNEEWKYWKQKLSQGKRMPVFFLQKDDKVTSFGLAMMYRLPYKNSISDAIRNTNRAHFPRKGESFAPDLADMIFGYVAQDFDAGALKGRVQVGHFKETAPSNTLQPITKNLGSPKPTFYPHYVRQPKAGKDYTVPKRGRQAEYTTYMDDQAEIRGWKRYPIENNMADMQSVVPSQTTTTFKPIDKGAVFKGKIRFHNLRPFELGALLWSITLGNRTGCFHNIGMAKPLGFGRARLDIENMIIHYGQTMDLQSALKAFENHMEQKLPGWKESEQIKELLTMADARYQAGYDTDYPALTVRPNVNEFAKLIKGNGLVLPSYAETAIKDETVQIRSREQEMARREREAQIDSLKQENPDILKILELTNSQLKDFIRDQTIPVEEKVILLDAYPLLKGGQKSIIDNALVSGRGAIYNNLTLIEEATGRKFPR